MYAVQIFMGATGMTLTYNSKELAEAALDNVRDKKAASICSEIYLCDEYGHKFSADSDSITHVGFVDADGDAGLADAMHKRAVEFQEIKARRELESQNRTQKLADLQRTIKQ